MKKIIIVLSVIFLLPFYLCSQNDNHKTNSKEESHFHYNHFALFAGASSLYEKNETHFTLGADYIRYFSPECDFAVGIYSEVIFAHHTEWIFGSVIIYAPTKNLRIRSGPGIELIQEEVHSDCNCNTTKTMVEFLIRIGTLYDFHLGKFSISPSLDIDFLRSTTTLVWGVSFGMGF
jgi:hypothetical protein